MSKVDFELTYLFIAVRLITQVEGEVKMDTKEILLSNNSLVPMTKEQVLHQFNNFLWKNAMSYHRTTSIDVEDLYQLTCVALMKAYNSYDSTSGYKFITYLSAVITGELNSHLRKHKNYKAKVVKSINEKINMPKGDSVEFAETLEDSAPAVEDTILSTMITSSLSKFLRCLTAREQTVIFGLFWKNKTQSQVSQELHLSQAHISRIKREALNKLSRLMYKDYSE